MDKDRIFRQIQDIITNPTPPVIVLGSGASVSYGIASMGELAKMLKTFFTSNVYQSQESNECVKRFLDFLNSGNGLEEALLKAKGKQSLRAVLRTLIKIYTFAPNFKFGTK